MRQAAGERYPYLQLRNVKTENFPLKPEWTRSLPELKPVETEQGTLLIPAGETLYQDLIGPETVPRLDGKIQLQSKEDMKKLGLPSPNRGDAMALTYAFPITVPLLRPGDSRRKARTEYDLFGTVGGDR